MDIALKNIDAQISRLQQEQERLKATLRRTEEVRKIIVLMRDTAITPQEVPEAFGARRSTKPKAGNPNKGRARGPVAAKYRHPATGASWRGRGRTPRWLAAEEGASKSREEYRNGRSIREFVGQVARGAGYAIDWKGVDRADMIRASIEAYEVDSTRMASLIRTNICDLDQERAIDLARAIVGEKWRSTRRHLVVHTKASS
ncbi:H-NS histone family protein [Achromobacter pulmonis]|uniref:H-NS histone family protein n=1 Tax=Achromobacter pulmonis TaxID=1389932 RepID=UPI001EEF5372|nr:H-NS histone family protein [Achromobacter pulmonis]